MAEGGEAKAEGGEAKAEALDKKKADAKEEIHKKGRTIFQV